MLKDVDGPFDILVDYTGGDNAAIVYLATHYDEGIGPTTIVLSELYRVLMATQEMAQVEVMSKYEWVEPMEYTNKTAAEVAEIYLELHANEKRINKIDIYIAGTARSLGSSTRGRQ